MHGKRAGLALLAAALTLLLSGCFVKTVDELYTLPRHSDEYDRLELAIDAVLSGQSAVYSAPVSGPNQQSVQLADLDGDGQEEAIAFLKAAGDRPLRACIFSRVDGDYHLTDVIEGVEQPGMATAGQNKQAVPGFKPQGKFVVDQV